MALWISCTDLPPAQCLRCLRRFVRFLSYFNELHALFYTEPVQPPVDKLCGHGCRPRPAGLCAHCTFIDRSLIGASIHRRTRLLDPWRRIRWRRVAAGRLRAFEQRGFSRIGGTRLRRRLDIGLRGSRAGRTGRRLLRQCQGGETAEQAGEEEFHRASSWADMPWTTDREPVQPLAGWSQARRNQVKERSYAW